MKTLAVCLAVWLTCMTVTSLSCAQAPSGSGKAAAGTPPREVCQAIESYLSKIDSAKAQVDATKRADTYAEANAELGSVLKKNNRTPLFAEATQYATYAEQIHTRDATDPELPDLIDKRLKVRAALLDLCAGYTITR